MTAHYGPMDPQRQDPADDPERCCVEAAGRDPAAFEYLYNRYFPRVYGYVYHRVSAVQDSEDLVGDIFFRAMDALGRGQFTWKHEDPFAAWLFRIAHNAVSTYFRTQSPHLGSVLGGEHHLDQHKRAHIVIVPLEDLHCSEEAIGAMPEAAFIQAEEHAQLRRLLARVPPRRQEIITLKFFGGLRNREIAQALGLGERTVASQLCRGIDDLQHLYEQEAQHAPHTQDIVEKRR